MELSKKTQTQIIINEAKIMGGLWKKCTYGKAITFHLAQHNGCKLKKPKGWF